jgi:hypothetical protein
MAKPTKAGFHEFFYLSNKSLQKLKAALIGSSARHPPLSFGLWSSLSHVPVTLRSEREGGWYWKTFSVFQPTAHAWRF